MAGIRARAFTWAHMDDIALDANRVEVERRSTPASGALQPGPPAPFWPPVHACSGLGTVGSKRGRGPQERPHAGIGKRRCGSQRCASGAGPAVRQATPSGPGAAGRGAPLGWERDDVVAEAARNHVAEEGEVDRREAVSQLQYARGVAGARPEFGGANPGVHCDDRPAAAVIPQVAAVMRNHATLPCANLDSINKLLELGSFRVIFFPTQTTLDAML